jgi:hypothetical protein
MNCRAQIGAGSRKGFSLFAFIVTQNKTRRKRIETILPLYSQKHSNAQQEGKPGTTPPDRQSVSKVFGVLIAHEFLVQKDIPLVRTSLNEKLVVSRHGSHKYSKKNQNVCKSTHVAAAFSEKLQAAR